MAITTPIRIRKVPQPVVRIRVVRQPKTRIRVLPKIIPADGEDGEAATVTVGTVTTLPAGSDATVVNSGTENAAVFDFGIPQGDPGIGQVESVNGQQGVVVLDADDIDDTSTTHKFASAAELALVASSLQPDDIGVSVQAWHTNLDDWSNVNPVGYYTAAQINAGFQPLDADLTSWAGVTRASGFDTFAATPSSANLRSLLMDEDGTGPALFGGSSYIREKLTAARTYYVRSNGSDSNTGLVNDASGAFLTIAKAIAVVSALDLSIYNVTIQLEDTTWSEAVSVTAPWIGSGTVTLRGATNACTISAVTAVTVNGYGSKLTLSNLTIAGSAIGIAALNGGVINIGANIVFAGANSVGHIRTNAGIVTVDANYSITTGGNSHLFISPGGIFNMFGFTATLTGTLSFTTAFAIAQRLGLISCSGGSSFTGGTITGKRYDAILNSVIFTNGGGASFFPGDVGGTTATGGQYG